MIIQPAVSALRPGYAAPGRATTSTQTAVPSDQVQLSGAVTNPWPELQKAGVLTASSSINGSIGSVITQTVRQDLTASLERMGKAGVKFEYRRRLALPFGLRDRYGEMSPGKAADFVCKNKPDGLGRLEITMPGAERRPVHSLVDLKLADAALGADVLEPDEKTSMECLLSLESKGFKPYNNSYYNEPNDRLAQLKTLHHGRDVYFTSPDGKTNVQANKTSLLALDYFAGSGQDRGLKDPVFAGQLKEAEKNGFQFRYDRNTLSLHKAYLSELKNAQVRKGDSILVSVSKADLSDLGKLGQRIHEADQVFDEVLAGPYAEMGYEKASATIPAVVEEGSQKFPIKVAAAVFGELLLSSRRDEDGYKAGERATDLTKKLYQECSTPFELARKAALVSATYKEHGYKAAHKVLAQTQDVITARAANNPQRQEQLEDLFFTLLSASGSITAASEGLDLVRISVGSEKQEDRTGLFQAIARRLPAGSTDQTAFCYRTVLAERLESETLQATGDRFCKLLEGMSVGRHQDRATEVFSYFQQEMRDGSGDPRQADTQVRQFLQALVIHDDVDKALNSNFGGTTAPGSISQTEEMVVIGGIRVPRKG